MDLLEKHDIFVGGRRFPNLDALEDYCTRFPDFEETVIESGVLSDTDLRSSVDTYWIMAEMEYGDGNNELPYELRFGWYGDALMERAGW